MSRPTKSSLRRETHLAESWFVVQSWATVSMSASSNFKIEGTINPGNRMTLLPHAHVTNSKLCLADYQISLFSKWSHFVLLFNHHGSTQTTPEGQVLLPARNPDSNRAVTCKQHTRTTETMDFHFLHLCKPYKAQLWAVITNIVIWQSKRDKIKTTKKSVEAVFSPFTNLADDKPVGLQEKKTC